MITASQISSISERRYTPSFTGEHYPDGILNFNEEVLIKFCSNVEFDEVIFAYNNIEHAAVMQKASIALSSGVDFKLFGPKSTMIQVTDYGKLKTVNIGSNQAMTDDEK